MNGNVSEKELSLARNLCGEDVCLLLNSEQAASDILCMLVSSGELGRIARTHNVELEAVKALAWEKLTNEQVTAGEPE